jgi:hypothetical protein
MRPRHLSLTALVLLVTLLFAACAEAAYDPIASGTTTITFTKSFSALLKQNGVKLSAVAPATVRGQTVTFPVSGGKLEPVVVKGSVEHAGALLFKAGKRTLPLKSLTLKTTQAHSPLTAKFGGGQLKIAASATLTSARSGFGVASKVTQIKLSAKAAERLDKKLDLRGVFKAGQLLGASTTIAQPASVTIKAGGSAGLQLAPEFAAKLQSLFVAVNPIFPAEHLGAPFTLAITGGQIATDATSGILETAGALELIQQDGGQAFFRNLAPELGLATTRSEYQFIPAPTAPGPITTAPLLGLSAGVAANEPKARTISFSAPLTLLPATAAALNETFAKPQGKANLFAAGETTATLSFTALAE